MVMSVCGLLVSSWGASGGDLLPDLGVQASLATLPPVQCLYRVETSHVLRVGLWLLAAPVGIEELPSEKQPT